MSYVWVECGLKRGDSISILRESSMDELNHGRERMETCRERKRPEGPFRVTATEGDKNQERKSLWTKFQRDH